MKINNTNKQNKESFTIIGDWEKQSTQLKETFSQLTDVDLKFEAGKENDLLKRVQVCLGKTRAEVIDLLRRGQVAPPFVIA